MVDDDLSLHVTAFRRFKVHGVDMSRVELGSIFAVSVMAAVGKVDS